MKHSSANPRYRQDVTLVIESSVPTDVTEFKEAVQEILKVTVISCRVSEPELYGTVQ